MNVVARPRSQPCPHLGVLVSAIVVDDQMDIQLCWDVAVNVTKEGEKLVMSMERFAMGDDLTGGDVQHSAAETAESLFALWVARGERCQDMDRLREDRALSELLGYRLPSSRAVRDFLEAFHADDLPLLRQGALPFASADRRWWRAGEE